MPEGGLAFAPKAGQSPADAPKTVGIGSLASDSRRRRGSLPPIDLTASRLRPTTSGASSKATTNSGSSLTLTPQLRPPPLRRSESEKLLAETHKRLSSTVAPFSTVHLWMAAALGAASQILFAAFAAHGEPPASTPRVLTLLWYALTLRFLHRPFESAAGWLLSGVIGAAVGALLWSGIVHVLLPVYRLHLKRRTVWPLSCEPIRLSDPKWQAHWDVWIRGIDANTTDAVAADEWGALDGATALRLMTAYQSDPTFAEKQPKVEFVCLRFYPTPPPSKRYTSWFDYFRRRRASPSPSPSFATQPTASPSPTTTTSEAASASPLSVPVSATPALLTPALTPYPDLVSLRTPTVATPWAPASGSQLPSVTEGDDGTVADDTVALVFLTVLRQYDLRPYLPRVLSGALALAVTAYRQLRGKGVDQAGASDTSLSMSLGLIGFQFPFRTGVFFTRKLAFFQPYSKAFAKPIDQQQETNININTSKTDNSVMSAAEREARIARYALIMQVLTEWNVSDKDASTSGPGRSEKRARIDLLFHASAAGSVSVEATRRVAMLPISVPASYIADLRPWAGAKWSAYTAALRKEGKRVREAPFEKAGGTVDFTRDEDMPPKAINMWHAVAKKQAETGDSHPTLLQPTEGWLRQLLAPLRNGSDKDESDSVATILRLRLPQGLAATSVVCEFGRFLATSDVAGFDYSVLDEAEQAVGHKVPVYSNKLANVLRRAMARGIQFVDFGPTTGEPKRQVGCQTVPLYGAAICAQVHLLWLARLAATAVALNQQLPHMIANTATIARRTWQRIRSGDLHLQTMKLPSTSNTSPSAPTTGIASMSSSHAPLDEQHGRANGVTSSPISSSLSQQPAAAVAAAAPSSTGDASSNDKDSDAARSHQKQQERAARKEARRKEMEQRHQQHAQQQQRSATDSKADSKPGSSAQPPSQSSEASHTETSNDAAAAAAARSKAKQEERLARKEAKRREMEAKGKGRTQATSASSKAADAQDRLETQAHSAGMTNRDQVDQKWTSTHTYKDDRKEQHAALRMASPTAHGLD